MTDKCTTKLFKVASVYDLILGIVFLSCYEKIYTHFGIELPNHPAFIQFPAALIFIFGIGFWMVAKDPVANRGIICLGILMKIAFISVIGGHYFLGSIPVFFLPLAVCDLLFLIAFLKAYKCPTKA